MIKKFCLTFSSRRSNFYCSLLHTKTSRLNHNAVINYSLSDCGRGFINRYINKIVITYIFQHLCPYLIITFDKEITTDSLTVRKNIGRLQEINKRSHIRFLEKTKGPRTAKNNISSQFIERMDLFRLQTNNGVLAYGL